MTFTGKAILWLGIAIDSVNGCPILGYSRIMSLLWGFVSKALRPMAVVSSSTTTLLRYQVRHIATASNNTSFFGRLNNSMNLLNNSSNHHLLTTLRFTNGGKTNKSAAKRFRVRGSGSLKRYVPFHQSLNWIQYESYVYTSVTIF